MSWLRGQLDAKQMPLCVEPASSQERHLPTRHPTENKTTRVTRPCATDTWGFFGTVFSEMHILSQLRSSKSWLRFPVPAQTPASSSQPAHFCNACSVCVWCEWLGLGLRLQYRPVEALSFSLENGDWLQLFGNGGRDGSQIEGEGICVCVEKGLNCLSLCPTDPSGCPKTFALTATERCVGGVGKELRKWENPMF